MSSRSGHKQCAIIDPVLDFDEKSGATATINADRILDYIEQGLTVEWILDTHPHADHSPPRDISRTRPRANRHWRESRRSAEALEGFLQLA
jgi:glyoxylase-like metal-dependent hydrolase (beta-lactamase superfamily II)